MCQNLVCKQLLHIDCEFTHDNLENKLIQTTKSSNPIGFKKKKLFRPTCNTIMLNIENNIPFQDFNWFFIVLTNLPNPITHLIISSLKIINGKIFRPPNHANFIGHDIFLHIYTQAYSTPSLLLYTNTMESLVMKTILDKIRGKNI